jgi:predicted acetyltransferase
MWLLLLGVPIWLIIMLFDWGIDGKAVVKGLIGFSLVVLFLAYSDNITIPSELLSKIGIGNSDIEESEDTTFEEKIENVATNEGSVAQDSKYLSSKEYLTMRDSIYGWYHARAAINNKLTFGNGVSNPVTTVNSLNETIDNFIVIGINGAGDENYLSYDLSQKYTELSFTLSLAAETKDTPQEGIFKIYGDDKEIYAVEVDKGFAPESIKLELKGVSKIKFELVEVSTDSYKNKGLAVILEKPVLKLN